MDLIPLHITEDQAYIVHMALGLLIDKTGSTDLPRAFRAADHVSDQRLAMLEHRLSVAEETKALIGALAGLSD